MKKNEVLDAIAGKLFSEGVLAENYNTNDALMVLSHCVMPIKLQTYLVNCEEEVKMILKNMSQIKQINATENAESLPKIKQQFTAKLEANMEDMPPEFNQIVNENFFDLI